MWSDLLPKMVGGLMVDDDAPYQPTEVVGYKLSDEWVEITGQEFSFRAKREYVNATRFVSGLVRIQTTFGEACTVTLPTEADLLAARETK
jgi:hypothetical protein